MDINDLRPKDFEDQISSSCNGCGGVALRSNGRETWLVCFDGRKSGECAGPFTMAEFIAEAMSED